jgi:hypothetical protein
MVVVDVAVANVWMAVLLFFAGRDKAMDEKIGADSAGGRVPRPFPENLLPDLFPPEPGQGV